ncbi:glycosyltransferase [Gemmobacter fulvus]|uniref:glycosyltransferase n=1 Tax=Gemmobacter fulvus TaxID=2840474 RepID=UPI002796D404|nr:glycosyltransferase [Gemmobacter fulvus]MDQ1847027.1 glycosyltransferase [Gemmobacter fulvus]
MKIAYLVNTYPRASHTFIRREVQALERVGFSVHRFAMRSDRATLSDPEDEAEDQRTEHVLEAGKLALAGSALGWVLRHPLAALRATATALRLGARAGARARHLVYLAEAAHVAARCDSLGIRHLHAHFGTNPATVALLCHQLGGPRYSFTLHGPEEFDAPQALSLAEKIHHAAFSVAISSYGRSQLCRWADVADWPRLKVVHCGIEPWRFADPAPLPAKLRLVAIGRFSEQKGFPLLIEALGQAVRQHPGLHLTLVGDGPLRGEIEALIETYTLRRHVTLTGWLPEARVREELAAAQALILPSFAEGLPMVVMEAMAAARPVIATAIAGLPELVVPETGWLVPAGDALALADAIDALAETPLPRLTAMGQTARQRVFARHDIDREATKLALLIRNAADA